MQYGQFLKPTDHTTFTFVQTPTQVFTLVGKFIIMLLQALGGEMSLPKDTL